MRTPLALARLALVTLVPTSLLSLACDTTFLAPPREIERDTLPVGDEPGDAGEGEGEDVVGEGEGEVEVADTVCGGQYAVDPGEPIPLGTTRTRHAAAKLRDGRVLVAGGHDEATWLSLKSAELFDPATNTFAPTGDMLQSRYDFALVALDDGRALALGGFSNDTNGDLATTEIFEDGVWRAGPALPETRMGLSAVKVADGRVLVFGGPTGFESIPTSVLVFDPADDSLVEADGELSFARTSHTAHLMSDGRAIMIGGYYTGVRDDVDVIDATGDAARLPSVPGARRSSCAANDGDGHLLLFGGYDGQSLVDVQAFDPATQTWSAAGFTAAPRFACVAAELSCASLICGGVDETSCEIRDHGAAESVIVIEDTGNEFSGTLTALDGERALLVGGFAGEGVSGTARVIALVAP